VIDSPHGFPWVATVENRNYVLISPARNEEAIVERTIGSVLSQTVLPEKWVVVLNGSTDRTEEIVGKYANKHSIICLIRARGESQPSFGSKVNAFRTGYELIQDLKYNYIGNLDADVSFGPNYFEQVLSRFEQNHELGIGGGIIEELIDGQYVPQTISSNSVAGAVQLFRRRCYEDIGGYIPIETGGIDSAAEIMARMQGWRVQTFPELKVLHHRRVTTGGKNILCTRFQKGMTHYLLGYHPFFHLLSCLYRITEKPYFLGSILMLCGYLWPFFRRHPRTLPSEVVSYLHMEQMERIGLGILKRAQTSVRNSG